MKFSLALPLCLASLAALSACGGGDPVDQPLSEDEVRQLEAAAEMLDSREDAPADAVGEAAVDPSDAAAPAAEQPAQPAEETPPGA